MSQTKTIYEMTPEERQKMVDDFCEGWAHLRQSFRDAARAIVGAWNCIPPEVRDAVLAEHAASDEALELPEPDQIIHKGNGVV